MEPYNRKSFRVRFFGEVPNDNGMEAALGSGARLPESGSLMHMGMTGPDSSF